MKSNEINLVYGNYKDPDLIIDFLVILRRFFESNHFKVESSKHLRFGMTNLLIEEFCHNPDLINEIRIFKEKKKGKLVVLLTEFLTGDYLNSFSFKKNLMNRLVTFYFKNYIKDNYAQIQIKKIKKPSLNFFENILLGLMKFFKTSEINIAHDFAEINYQQRRLNGIKYVKPYVDLWMGLYKSQNKDWDTLLNQVLLFNLAKPRFEENSEHIKKYDFFFSGKLTKDRKKLLDELNYYIKVFYPKNGYLSSKKRDFYIKKTKFLLCLPRENNWPFSSCIRSWNALENGAIPINLRHFELSPWESKLDIERVNSFNVKELKALLENYGIMKSDLLYKLKKTNAFNSKNLLADLSLM